MKPPSFQDKVVVITGTSSGIGQALALRLAGEGAFLALAARRRQRQVAMRPGWPALWLKLISLALLDRFLLARVMGPVARRVQGETGQQG